MQVQGTCLVMDPTLLQQLREMQEEGFPLQEFLCTRFVIERECLDDGVDIISVSIGLAHPENLSQDSIAIGSFHAMAKGILTLNGAANNGPNLSLTTSVAPWMVSVAASTTDRHIITKVVLGDAWNNFTTTTSISMY